MKIQILGSGCKNCQKLHDNAKEAVRQLCLDIQIEKIQDIQKITEMGALKTPALAIDGNIKLQGKISDVDEIKKLLK